MTTVARCFVVAAALAAAAPAAGQTGEWAGWRGPSHDLTVFDPDGIRTDQTYRFEVVWKKDIGSAYSAISVRDGVAVTGSSDSDGNYMEAFDADTGEPLWRTRIGEMFPGRFGSSNGPIATPLIADGHVFALDNQGGLFALELATGAERWRVSLVEDLGAGVPFYGYAASPLWFRDSVIVQASADFDGPGGLVRLAANTGEVLWSVSIETSTQYQSASFVEVRGELQVVLVGDEHLVGVDPDSGSLLWQAPHGGLGIPTGSATTNLVPTAPDTILVKTRENSRLLRVRPDAPDDALELLWETPDLKHTYVVSVHHDDVLYGYNDRILNAVDTFTGERLWRSREPGDGFLMVLNDHLVVVTKDGDVSMAPAGPDGFAESARLEVFDSLVWTPPTYVAGRLYARSLTEWARIDIVPAEAPVRLADRLEGILPASDFEARAASIRAAPAAERPSLVDAWLGELDSVPVVEGRDQVHFVYFGEAQEVALLSDLFGGRTDRKMRRIEGTDFFYFSTELENDARLEYSFAVDFGAAEADPANPRRARIDFGDSELVMPGWTAPAHLEEPPVGRQGTIESASFDASSSGATVELGVYLPSAYSGERRYPVVYMLDTRPEMAAAHIKPSLDNLMGDLVEPAIVVFVPYFGPTMPYVDYVGDGLEAYLDVVEEQLVPLIDSTYSTIEDPVGRAVVGRNMASYAATYATFNRPGLFGRLGLQSMRWEPGFRSSNQDMLRRAPQQDLAIYLDWARYDGKSEREGFDVRGFSLAFAEDLKAAGYVFTGGEAHDGSGPNSWIQRTDRLLEAILPIER